MPGLFRFVVAAGADSLAFPRQFVKWVFSTQGDSAYAHAGAELRESMKSPAAINEMAGRIAMRFGERRMHATEDFRAGFPVRLDHGAAAISEHGSRHQRIVPADAWLAANAESSMRHDASPRRCW